MTIPLNTDLLLLIALLTCASSSQAGFSEVPSNITLLIGSDEEAVFRCSHETTGINWLINGEFFQSGQFPGVVTDFVNENGTIVHTLSIPATSDYNETEVMCLATFLDAPPDKSPPVILTLIAGGAVPTTMTDTISNGFVEYPTSTTLLLLESKLKATFRCSHRSSVILSWLVDGSPSGDFPGAEEVLTNENGTSLRGSTLTIPAIEKNNGTVVMCLAIFIDGPANKETPSVTLTLMAEPLDSVINLLRNTSTLSWEPPFSLDLSGVDPDIVYCVEVYNITCGRSLLISECDVMETSYTNDALLPGYIYEYTVTPRSNVEGARNGTSLTVSEQFPKLNESSMRHSVSMMNSTESEYPTRGTCDFKDIPTNVTIHLDTYQGVIRPELYSVILNSLDGVQTHGDRLEATSIHENDGIIVLEVLPLPFRRLWSVTLYAHDCELHPLIKKMELGTHDFHSISITSPPNSGVVMVTGDIIPGSSSIGILVIVHSFNEPDDYSVHYQFINYADMEASSMTMSLPADQYKVVVFVVDKDGRPFCRAAATPRTVHIDKAVERQPSPSVKYELHPTSTGVCITCTFLGNSVLTDCVAVVHQRISQLGSSGLMNIESSHKFNRSGDTAYGCIEGVDLEQYQLGVVGGATIKSNEQPSDQCSTLCQTVATIIPVAFVLALSIIAIIIFVYISRKRKKIRQMQQTARSVHMLESDTRYETVHLRIQSDGGGDTQAATATPGTREVDPTTPLPTTSGEGLLLNSSPPLPPPRSKDTDPVYTGVVTVSGSSTVHRPPATEVVVYDDIKAFRNEDGQQYAILPNLRKTGEFVDPEPNRTVYSEIQHVLSGQQVQTTDISSKTVINTTKQLKEDSDTFGSVPIPFTIEHLLPELLPYATKWQSMGLALSLDDDRLDEIFTNNETDEACLHEMLEVYMTRPDLNHSWEEVQEALKKAREESAVNQPGVSPGEESITIQLEVPSTVSDKVLTEQKDSQDQERTSLQPPTEKEDPSDNTEHTEPKDDGDVHHPSQQGTSWSDNQQECVDAEGDKVSADLDEGLTEEQNSQDQEIINTSPSEKGDPPHSPQHTEPEDDGDTQDISQQGANFNDTQQEHAEAEDYQSDFDQQIVESNESTNQDGGKVESGQDATPSISEKGSLTDDNRNMYDVKKSEEYQSNSCALVPFNTQCEEQTIDRESGKAMTVNGDHEVWLKSVCNQANEFNSTSELVCPNLNWHFMKQCNIVMPRSPHLNEA